MKNINYQETIMEKLWFEMPNLIRKNYEKSVWIPLLSYQVLNKQGKIGYEGYVGNRDSDYF